MQQNPSRTDNGRSVRPWIPPPITKPYAHYCAHTSVPLHSVSIQINPVSFSMPYWRKPHYDFIPSPTQIFQAVTSLSFRIIFCMPLSSLQFVLHVPLIRFFDLPWKASYATLTMFLLPPLPLPSDLWFRRPPAREYTSNTNAEQY